MIRIYFKTTPIIIKFLEQCILPRIMPVSKCVFVININFVRHHTMEHNRKSIGSKIVSGKIIGSSRVLTSKHEDLGGLHGDEAIPLNISADRI